MLKNVNVMSERCFPPLSIVALWSSSCNHCGLSQRPISLGSLIYGQSQFPDLHLCDFWLWGYLKDVFRASLAYLNELKARIAQRILNVTPKTLRSFVDHAVSRFKLLIENGRQHIEHVLQQPHEIKKKKNHGCFLCSFCS